LQNYQIILRNSTMMPKMLAGRARKIFHCAA